MNAKARVIRTGFALFLSAGSAYAFSFAIDLLLGGIFGVFPNTVYLPVITWSIISAVTLVSAIKIAPSSWLFVPFVVFGIFALFGALVGTHPHSFGVAGIMLLQAIIIGFVFRKPRKL